MKKWYILYILSALIIIIIIFTRIWNIFPQKNYDTEIHFLEIPIGNCTLIKTKEKNVLIGEASEKDSKYIKEYLNSQKVNTISELIIASPSKEKVLGFEDLLKHYDVEKIYLPHITDLDKPTNDFLNVAKNDGVFIYQINNGEEWKVGEITLSFFRPSSDTTIPEKEKKAIVKLTLPKKSILLLPTMEKIDKIDLMLSSSKLKADILKVNGKGREEFLQEDFLKAVNPDVIIFANNSKVKEKELQSIYSWDSSVNVVSIYEEGYLLFYGEKGKYSMTSRKNLSVRVQ